MIYTFYGHIKRNHKTEEKGFFFISQATNLE